ncbi:ankyrin repeat-containing domain protein [Pestalotiopsis sp. NC0098]|nr:ankyrin repeat-containing domain protein [Pestalotiopsis sp. NC0098]
MFFKSSEETTKALKGVQDDLQRVVEIIRPIEGMQQDLKEWEEHIRVIRDAVQYSSLASTLLDEKAKPRYSDSFLDFITQIRLEPKHQDVIKVRHEDTALWAMESTEFRGWVDQQAASCLWMHGIPGCDREAIVVAVYVSHQDTTLHSIEAMLQAVLRSAVQSLRDTDKFKRHFDRLEALRQAHKKRGSRPSSSECLQFVKDIASPDEPLILCFDGFDELPGKPQVQLLSAIEDLIQSPGLKVLIMSRSNLNLRTLPHSEMAISARRSDLTLFLNHSIEEIIDDMVVDGIASPPLDFRQKIIDQIIDRSNGMFLLASLSVQQLRSASSPRDMLERLEDLPGEIDQQYSLYFDRVKAHPRSRLALLAIQWVKCAFRPLQLRELVEALAVRPGDHCLDATGMVSPETIINSTLGLLVLDTESKVVRLVHDSLREYLDRHESKIFEAPHRHTLTVLNTYLSFEIFHSARWRSGIQSWVDIGILKKDYQLLEYACNYWYRHFDAAGPIALPLGLHTADRVSASTLLLRVSPNTNKNIVGSGLSSLHVALLWGSTVLVEEIIRTTIPADFENMSKKHLTPLHLAARLNETPCARLLVQAGHRLDQKDREGRTPIHEAASHGSSAVLSFMLESSNESDGIQRMVDGVDNQRITPLHLALIECHAVSVEILLRHKADVNAQTHSGQTPAQLAILYCPAVVELLISSGAGFTSISKDGRSALHCVCQSGKITPALQAMLQHADPNLRDKSGSTPLQALCGCAKADLESVLWLVQLGAQINWTTADGWSPLHLALGYRHYTIAEYLLSQGAKADIATSDGTPPILTAIGLGNCPQDLLGRLFIGNDFLGLGGTESLLHRAVRRQKAAEVDGIIRNGGNVHLKNDKGETPLHIAALLCADKRSYSACKTQKSDIVSILLLEGADPHLESSTGYTPVQIAAIRGVQLLLQQLLDASPDLDRSLFLPDGTSILNFSAVHHLKCFKVIEGFSTKKWAESWPLLQIARMLSLDMGCNNLLESKGRSYNEILGTHKTALGLSTAEQSADTDFKSHVCGVNRLHKMSCREFSMLCEKAAFLCNRVGRNGDFLALQPEVVAAFGAWQANCSNLLDVSNDFMLNRIHRAGVYQAKRDVEGTFHTGCGHDAISLMACLRWPEMIADSDENQQIPGQSSESEHVWQDDLKLRDSDKEPESQKRHQQG